MTLIQMGQSLEGSVVDGQSRKPLKNLGLARIKGKVVYAWKGDFNARAWIVEPLGQGGEKLLDESVTERETDIVAENVTVYSLRSRYKGEVGRGSHTHNTNTWHFPQHTAVRIDLHKESLVNAHRKFREVLTGKSIEGSAVDRGAKMLPDSNKR